MSRGTDLLRYRLYADPSRQVPWGNGTAAPARTASGPDADLTVYGRIPAGQNVGAGTYSDVVTVQLSF
jgi:spore coat protein U-like protein